MQNSIISEVKRSSLNERVQVERESETNYSNDCEEKNCAFPLTPRLRFQMSLTTRCVFHSLLTTASQAGGSTMQTALSTPAGLPASAVIESEESVNAHSLQQAVLQAIPFDSSVGLADVIDGFGSSRREPLVLGQITEVLERLFQDRRIEKLYIQGGFASPTDQLCIGAPNSSSKSDRHRCNRHISIDSQHEHDIKRRLLNERLNSPSCPLVLFHTGAAGLVFMRDRASRTCNRLALLVHY